MDLRLDGRVRRGDRCRFREVGIRTCRRPSLPTPAPGSDYLDVDEAGVSTLARELPGERLGVECDVTDAASVKRAIAQVGSAFGPVGVLVNNAGVTQRRSFSDITGDDYDRVVDVVCVEASCAVKRCSPS